MEVVAGKFTMRGATEQDFPAIRRLIHEVGINPMSLDWRRFLVVTDASGNLIGCGQLKPHGKSIVELASIAVAVGHRRRGVARAIIEQLLARARRPVYLTCRASLGPFYERWGFRAIGLHEMPVYFRRLARLARVFTAVTRENDGLLVMELK